MMLRQMLEIHTNPYYYRLYIIQSGELYKIGIARDVEVRRKQMQVGNPIQLNIIVNCSIPWAKEIEPTLHLFFRKKRIKREWFKLNDDDLKIIKGSLSDLIYQSLSKEDQGKVDKIEIECRKCEFLEEKELYKKCKCCSYIGI